jgi:hypothetical protein
MILTKYELENRRTKGDVIREIGESSRSFLQDLLAYCVFKLNSDPNRPVDLELNVILKEVKE